MSHRSASKISPEYPILGFLFLQPQHGYELQRRLQSELHEIWRLSQSQVYSILKRLQNRRLIRVTLQPQEKLPNREHLELTQAGRDAFMQWLKSPTRSSARAIRVEFLTRMYFAGQVAPGVSRQLFTEQQKFTLEDLSRLKQHLLVLPDQEQYNRLGLELRIRQLQSILEWLSDSRATLVREAGGLT